MRRRNPLLILAALSLLIGALASAAPRAEAAAAIRCVNVRRWGTTAPCTNKATYTSLQQAIRDSHQGDTIRLAAGVYTGGDRAVITIRQSVLTIEGGYAEDNWATPSAANRTVIDAEGVRRGIFIETAGVLLRDLTIQNGVALEPYKYGGGIYADQNQQGIVILDGVTLQNNAAERSGGGAAVVGPLQAYGTVVLSNRAGEDGGGLWAAEVELYGGELRDNRAGRSGGAVYGASAIDGASFIGNQAHNGGAAYIATADVSVGGSSFEDNRAGDAGGAIYRSDSAGAGSLTISGSVFVRNRAERLSPSDSADLESGGAVFGGVADNVNLTVRDSHFAENVAHRCCGAIAKYGYVGQVTISRSSFVNNTSITDTGGAVGFSIKGTLEDVDFIGNSAGTYGGGLAQLTPDNGTIGNSPLAIKSGRFINNMANGDGGAIYSREGVALTRALLRDNRSGGNGGGMMIVASQLSPPQPIIISDSQLRGNHAAGDGGALAMGGSVTIRATQIISNTADATGGGLRIFGYSLGSSRLTMTGVVLGDNRAGLKADGIFGELSELSLRNVTIASASLAPHAAIALIPNSAPLAATLDNTMVTSHTVGLDLIADMTLTGGYNNFFDNGQDRLVDGVPAALPWANKLAVAPRFADPTAHNFRLSAGSPLIAAGNPTFNYSGQPDIDGQQTRGRIPMDIGGDKYVSYSSRVHLPMIAKPLVP